MFGFGQTQQAPSPFGAPAANPFGAGAFGQPQQQQQQPAFGGGGLFGQTSAPAFGQAASAPAFGASTFGAQPARPAFGGFGATPAFGASQPAFGAASAPAFGLQQSQAAFGVAAAPSFGLTGTTTPAFGAPAAPAFGAASAPAFGAAPNPFGGSTFGSTSPAFGAASAPAFGMAPSAPAFGAAAPTAASPFGGGSSIFGGAAASPAGAFGSAAPQQAGGLFGAATGSTFGMQPQQPAVGTRAVPYQKTVEKESSGAAGTAGTPANYITITAMPAYNTKSQEELRWEDYQQGVKSAAAGPPQQASPSLFSTATGTLPFGSTPQTAAPATGFGTGTFGAPAPAFGAASAPTFGSPASAPAFGAASTSTFGFGAAAPTAGFGAASAPATSFFGASSAAFGQTQPTGSIFGAPSTTFGAASSPSLFGSSTGAFGAPASSSSIFSFNTAPNLFSTTQPAAAPAQTSIFGSTQTNPFGAATASPFSAAAPAGGLFATSQSAGQFGTSAFGAKPFSFASAPASAPSFASFSFASAASSSPGLFGATGTAFAPATAAAPGAFGFASSPGLFSTQVPGFGQALQATAMAQAQGPAPTVGQAPYGSFPALPTVAEPKVGISARPVSKGVANGAAGGGMGAGLRNSPLLSIRSASATPRFGVQVRTNAASPLALISATPAPVGSVDAAQQQLVSLGAGGAPAGSLLTARANPHRLFIREPPPGTEASASGAALSPVLTPARASPGGGGGTHGGGAVSDRQQQQHATPDRAVNGGGGDRRGNGGSGAEASREDGVLPRLGRLSGEGYTYEPSAAQLQAMHRADPDSIKQVSNFTVTRRGVGQIRWLKPVDVTGLPLHRIVTIQEGEVYCYADEDKPPVGHGLNTDAEVTLYNVYKRDPTTRQPIKEGPAVLKWEKALRTMCAKMGAKFVMYKADGGVWKFEVEHFSRYGLLDLEEEDEDEATEAQPGDAPGGRAFGRKVAPVRYGVGGGETQDGPVEGMYDEEDHLRGDQDSWTQQQQAGHAPDGGFMEDEDGGAAAAAAAVEAAAMTVVPVGAAAAAAAAATSAPAAPLQHSLPVQLNLDPSGLMAMHGSLFPVRAEGQSLAAAAAAPSRAPGVGGMGAPSAGAAEAGPRAPAQHLWRRAPSPLTSTSAGTRALLCKEPASAAASPMGGSPMLALPPADFGSTPSTFRGPAAAGLGARSTGGAATSACFVDAGLCLGPTFRVGWGPGGTLVYPGNLPNCHAVHTRRVLVEGLPTDPAAAGASPSSRRGENVGGNAPAALPEPPRLAAMRRHLRCALEVHLKSSSPDVPALSLDGAGAGVGGFSLDGSAAGPGTAAAFAYSGGAGPGGGGGTMEGVEGEGQAGLTSAEAAAVPKWSLLCDRRGLPRLVDAYLAGPESEAAAMQQQAAPDTEVLLALRHEGETWRLVQALWEYIEGEDDAKEQQQQQAEGLDQLGGDGHGLGVEASLGSLDVVFVGQGALAAFRRRRAVAQWLRRQAKGLVEAELSRVAEPGEAVLRLAAAGQPAAAAAVAVAAGDVRLATLLAQAGNGARSEAREEVEEQLGVWGRSDMLGNIARDRLLVYRLLAGQVDEVRDRLALDWRRYLALHLSYASSPTASPALAVHAYRQALLVDRAAPRPLPLYMDERSTQGRCRPRDSHSPSASDLHYELLCLWASAQEGGQYAEGWYEGQYESLLQAAAYSPNPLEASLAWHVMTTLQALRALPADVAVAGGDAEASQQQQQQQQQLFLAVHLNLVSQLRLVGGMCEWAVYVALHLPDVAGWPGLRTHLVRELLALHCPEWRGDEAKTGFLLETLSLPQALLAEAEAVWAQYQGDEETQCRALMVAGAWHQAHALLTASVAPAMFLSGREEELMDLLAEVQQDMAAAVGLEWEAGGGLYLAFFEMFGGAARRAGWDGRGEEEVEALLGRLQAAGEKLAAVVPAAAAGAQGPSAGAAAARRQRLQLQLVYSQMAAKLSQVVMGARAVGVGGSSRMAAMLGLRDGCVPSDLKLAGIATAAATVMA